MPSHSPCCRAGPPRRRLDNSSGLINTVFQPEQNSANDSRSGAFLMVSCLGGNVHTPTAARVAGASADWRVGRQQRAKTQSRLNVVAGVAREYVLARATSRTRLVGRRDDRIGRRFPPRSIPHPCRSRYNTFRHSGRCIDKVHGRTFSAVRLP
jgi:hypothetical protein